MEVEEGGSVKVTSFTIKVLTEYYRDKLDQFLVAKQPKYGKLQLTTRKGEKVQAFTPVQLQNKLIEVSFINIFYEFNTNN